MQNNFLNFLNKKKSYSPYIIAEIGSNHNGNLSLCEKQIKLAASAGANAVKFQKFNDKNLFSKESFKNKFLKISDVKKYSLSIEQFKKIEKMCRYYKIGFGITPLSFGEVEIVCKNLNVDFLKVASGDADNLDFIKFVAKKKKPTIISFGMCDKNEINNSVANFLKYNKYLAILHCVSIYPTPIDKINLNRIKTLKNKYKNIKIGFSDHSDGIRFTLASISMGAQVIEKHFTSNKDLLGWDHSISVNFDELKKLCSESKELYKAMGSAKLNKIENKNVINFFRRSIVVNKNLAKGHTIKLSDLDFKRPGKGISPNNIKTIVGKKLIIKKKADQVLYTKDLK